VLVADGNQFGYAQPVTGNSVVARIIPPRLSALGWLSLAMALLVMVPIVAVILELRHPPSDAWSFVATTLVPRYLANTAWLALGVLVLTATAGIGTAILVTSFRFAGVRLLEWLLVLPVAIPSYVLAYLYYDMLGVAGPVQSALRDATGLTARQLAFPPIASLPGAVFVLAAGLYPYVYVSARAAFLQQGRRLIETARMLGCSPLAAFLRVSLPLARPAIVAGLALVMMETLAEYGALSLLGVQTFTTGIYKAWFGMGDRVAAAQLATMLLGLVALLLWTERIQRRGRVSDTRHRGDHEPRTLTGWPARLAFTACLLPTLTGFVIPGAYLVYLAVKLGTAPALSVLPALGNSLLVAAITTAIALVAGLLIVYGARLSPYRPVLVANRIAASGYAIPGPVLAIGALIPLAALDGLLRGWLGRFGIDVGLLLTGTVAMLIFVYLVRFMTISIGSIEAGFQKVAPSMEDAAAMLGHNALQRLWYVHARLIAPAIAVAATLVFVDVIKELPATLILRPFEFDTLAVRVFNLASDERLREAAAPALLLVAIGLLPAWLLTRQIRR